ncbi:hypothetical protein P280DRAFT_471284 [Massarina eburnea CBS 473.64]|uniref:SnoaL-like domain-containing protein n=1 Tax=Massarina eburnea CBS 473.64 TaxID=1395130 RepID=A0A6A6RU53_9PLEO|nr:hypothetical protein P280DRAFT_471284 [Massarina eburnea CBS 473.64]
MSPLRDQLWHTAKTAFEAYGEMTPSSVIANRSPSCVHRMFPTSSGIPDRTNKEYSDFVMELKKTVSKIQLIVQDDFEPVIDEKSRQVIAHIKSAGESKLGPVEAEYFMALKMNEDGTEIVEFVEFIDTAYTAAFIQRAELKAGGVA